MILYSKQVCLYVLQHYSDRVNNIYLAKEIDNKQFRQIKKYCQAPILRIDNKKAQAMSKGHNHQGYFVEVKEMDYSHFGNLDWSNISFVVVLCGITDIGNIGAIIRTSYCLGVDAIIITGVKSVPMPHLIRTSGGAFFQLPIVLFHHSLEIVQRLADKGFVCIGADMKGEDVRHIDFAYKKALFVGSESTGLSLKVIKKMSKRVSVTMVNPFDSLNVANATAILIDRMR